MQLPRLTPGHRFTLPAPAGSADSALLAALAQDQQRAEKRLAIITADPMDAQRIADEIGFFAPSLRTGLFPDWETLPYDNFSPHQELISERLATLWQILQGEIDIVLIPAATALYRLAPPSFLAGHTFSFQVGEKLNDAKLKSQLTLAGYTHVTQVVSPGEYAVRGGIIDLYPMGSETPFRVDLFDDEVDSIRTFDPDTQRSLESVSAVRLLPGREFPMGEEARATFRANWRAKLEGDPTKSRIYKDMGEGIASNGIEYYLPLFFEQTATVFDYLGEQTTFALVGDLEAAFNRFWQDTRERHQLLQGDKEHPVLAPAELFLSGEQFYTAARAHCQLALRDKAGNDAESTSATSWARALPPLTAERGAEKPLAPLAAHMAQSGQRTLIVTESAGRRESLMEILRDHHIHPILVDTLAQFQTSKAAEGMVIAPLARGFAWLETGIDLITENEIFSSVGTTLRRRRRKGHASEVDNMVRDLAELQPGDPVVHVTHGVGRYEGLVTLDTDTGPTEFLFLRYADDATLYVPVAQLHLIGRYSGVNPEQAPLHKLGSNQWDKAKRKAAEQVRDTAAELLELYARRSARQGYAFRFPPGDYEAFAASFGFEETPDQQSAIHAVIQDMVSPQPMDRLVCGDVGFGKTEVALRAAFIAVTSGKQVAFLAPTTLLTEQHYQTLSDRFANWPVKVAQLSRFRTGKETDAALQGLADGSIDIVVGTHKLLSPDVHFKNLGLLIIDEEHRFGVRQKERMKAMRAEVDVLTLTATPIPRTLGMALEGIRELSVIATAPQRRLSIKTFVRTEGHGIIREALLRELKRGGQAYFLHNDVQSIEGRKEMLERLVPEARIAIAHGQMHERELERVMRDFIAQRYNVLLCSTIIETGIDVPTANTIVISRADRFGLAQLHQLRGRVGRSYHQGYAYLLVNEIESLTKQARQRLEAIQQMEDLGSGFYLAMHDLEIRGAGEILGESQSGNMTEVGFQMYNDMLAEAVRALKAGEEPDLISPLTVTTEINLHTPALLPENYCRDVHARLSLYKRLSSATTFEQVDAIMEEIADRFGQLPPPVHALIDTHRLRILSHRYGITRIDAGPEAISIQFKPNPPVDAGKIILLIQSERHIQLAGQDRLRVVQKTEDAHERMQVVRDLLQKLGPPLLPPKAATTQAALANAASANATLGKTGLTPAALNPNASTKKTSSK